MHSMSFRAKRGICSSLRRLKALRRQIPPQRILFFDQCHFLFPPPFLDLRLARNCPPHITIRLVIDQSMNPVLARKSRNVSLAMLPLSTDEVACNAYVKGSGP